MNVVAQDVTVTAVPGGVTAAAGFVAAAATAGLRSTDAPDLALVATREQQPACAAAIFTTNRFAAAPVLVARETLAAAGGRIRGVILNAGCANAGTGPAGLVDARRMASAAAAVLGCSPAEVLPASTGLIGSRLRVELIESAAGRLDPASGVEADGAAAAAIMTTDTRPKLAAVRAGGLTLGGMAKGSGMIHPHMATMLAVITTDADADPGLLSAILCDAADLGFNQVSVDGDTSTNDAVFLLASGVGPRVVPGSPGEAALRAGLTAVSRSLAQQIAADGEGARTRIDVLVTGAASDVDARRVARAVAASSLVKAAVHGGDPNWGRIASAAGQSEAELDPGRLTIHIGEQAVYEGTPLTYDEARASADLRGEIVTLALDLGLGDGFGEAWGCDLSAEYVAINSEYRT